MNQNVRAITGTADSALATNKLIRNTYTLLSVTLLFSALTAGISMAVETSFIGYLVSFIGSIVLIWFVLPRTANSAMGLAVVFGITGLMGFGLGPVLNHYLNLPNGSHIVMTALGGTGVIFLGLSGYALTTRKDFSFMAGFLLVGILVAFIGGLAAAIFDMPAMSLAISGMVVLLMSGLILYQTSQLVHGGETNYILATVSLYLSIYNLFTSLLQLLGAFSGDD
jgi:modulator of FtsH protease